MGATAIPEDEFLVRPRFVQPPYMLLGFLDGRTRVKSGRLCIRRPPKGQYHRTGQVGFVGRFRLAKPRYIEIPGEQYCHGLCKPPDLPENTLHAPTFSGPISSAQSGSADTAAKVLGRKLMVIWSHGPAQVRCAQEKNNTQRKIVTVNHPHGVCCRTRQHPSRRPKD